MLEYPKADGTSQVTIRSDEVKTEMDNQQVTQLEIGWLAGIIDGEGYMGIQTGKQYGRNSQIKYFSVELHVCNTDIEIINRYISILKKIGINPYVRKMSYSGKNGRKIAWNACVHRMASSEKLLSVIDPYLTGNKKIRSSLLLEFTKSRIDKFAKMKGTSIPYDEREIEIACKCFDLQKRGTSETIRKAELVTHQITAVQTCEKKVERVEKMLKLHEEGKSSRQIAIALGWHPNSGTKVKMWLSRIRKNDTSIQKLGYFPQYSDDIVRPFVKA